MVWAWGEFYHVCSYAKDPDFLDAVELGRLDSATTVLLHGSKVLSNFNSSRGAARWKMRPKLHTMQHINQDAQASGRNPRCWSSWQHEEMMGKLATIACATHALNMCRRSLEKWCLQFFNFMES